jgi:hypothetical protein
VDFTKTVPILIARVFAFAVADRLVTIAPIRQFGVDVLFVGHHLRTWNNGLGDEGLNRLLLHIGQHLDHDLPATLEHPEDGRLLFLKRAAPAFAL